MPDRKREWGYVYEPDKFGISGLTEQPSVTVGAPRVRECPVQMEAVIEHHRSFGANVSAYVFEARIVKLHVDESLLEGDRHIDPERWQPLIMSFCRFFSLGGEVHPSRLAESNFMTTVGGVRR